jgi:signal transduction histidine kinase
MNVALHPVMLEKMTEGVILLNPDGQVTDYNRAAKPWLKACLTGASALAALIGKVRAGQLQVPVAVQGVFQQAAGGADFHLCRNEPGAFAIFITAPVPAPAAKTSAAAVAASPQAGLGPDSFFALLGEDFRHELTGLRLQLADAPVPADSANHLARVQQQSLRLSQLLVAMEQLCELHEQDAFFQGDRVHLGALIDTTIAALPSRRSDFCVNRALSDADGKQGMLFGDARWLGIALTALLEEMGASAPVQAQVEIRVRQTGGFVVMTGQCRPFLGRSPPPAGAASPAAKATFPSFSADIRMAICQRIVALHGGQLKSVALDADQADPQRRGMASFVLSLPTGAPLHGRRLAACASCLAPRQTEQYAQDLAAVLPQLAPGRHAP